MCVCVCIYMYVCCFSLIVMTTFSDSYSSVPRIYIKGVGVHQWYMAFGSISVVKQCFQHKLYN